MPNLPVADGVKPAPDLGELIHRRVVAPAHGDATVHNAPDASRRVEKLVPWLYDYDYGWTPQREAAEPRPPLQMPPYLRSSFPLRTSTLAGAHHNAIRVNLKPFPSQARVFMVVPTGILPAKLGKRVVAGKTREVGPGVEVVRRVAEFNSIFDKRLKAAATSSKVVLELASGRMALLNDLRLKTTHVVLEIYYAIARQFVKPKTYYTLQAVQLTDHRLIGRFDHVFQAYHQYDVAVIGDRRTGLAYRRSSKEVADIPPLALAFFDSWQAAAAAGFDPHPRSYRRHYSAASISNALEAEVLAFVNQRGLSAKRLAEVVQDNPYVDAEGRPEREPTSKRGLDKRTAERILTARKKLERFSSLDQIDSVRGVGSDTLTDIVSSVLLSRRTRVKRGKGRRWRPQEAVHELLLPKAPKKRRRAAGKKGRKRSG
jgi:hypothetical protein